MYGKFSPAIPIQEADHCRIESELIITSTGKQAEIHTQFCCSNETLLPSVFVVPSRKSHSGFSQIERVG